MASIRDLHNSFRDRLVLASFRGVQFHVEQGQVSSGRRTVVHEYPKRNLPYSEDMGRVAVKFQMTGYLLLRDKGIKTDLMDQRDNLIMALQNDDAGMLIHPTLGEMLVMCERYSYTEQRTRGGYLEFDMQFVEAGSPAMEGSLDSGSALDSATTNTENTATSSLNNGLGNVVAGGKPIGQGGIGRA